jgi:hypothetical protein
MRNALILAFGLTLVGTAAWSQNSSRDEYNSSRDEYAFSLDNYGHRDRWHGDSDQWDRNRDEDRGSRMSDDERPGRGARFFLRNGDAQLRIVCGNRDTTQTCVDSALRLFDRVQSQPRTGSSSPSTSGPATTPPSAQ